jgi:C2 domain
MSSSCCFSILARFPRGPSKLDWLDNGNKPTVDHEGDGETLTVQNTTEKSLPVSDHPKESKKENKFVLMEIVGAMCLETKQRRKVDPYCTVRVYDREKQDFVMVHRTDTIPNDGNPIWTAKSKSLCLIEIPEPSNLGNNQSNSASADITPVGSALDADDSENSDCVMIDIIHGNSQFDVISTPILGLVSATPVLGSLAPTTILQQRLGRVRVTFSEILQCCNALHTQAAIALDRLEYPIKTATGTTGLLETATLALRFRFATEHDLLFLRKLSQSHAAVRESTNSSAENSSSIVANLSTALWQPSCDDRRVAADINFRHVKTKALALSYKKTDAGGIERFRVIPYPDPDRPDITTWMSAAEMERTAYEPSSKWVSAGGGTLGAVFLEILGCDNLPQMDVTNFSQTDAVVAVVFEDNFVRSDVIWDQLFPRWMPWTTRAFKFNLRHPASLLCISVLDCDEFMLEKHDPIGRIVVRPSSFRSETTYVLHYALQDDPHELPTTVDAYIDDEDVGDNVGKRRRAMATITIRLRIEWNDESAAMKMFFTPPPRFIVNVDSEKSYEVLTYTTRGLGYMHDASIKSVKLLANEIMEYGKSFCFTMDVLMEILLWRGRLSLTQKINVWFPIHSIALFAGSIALVERPDMIIPIFLFGTAWILLSLNYHASYHPNPWLRVPSYLETMCMTLFGRHSLFLPSNEHGSSIPSNYALKSTMEREKLDELKAARMSALIQATMTFLLKIYYIYSKTGNSAIKITTDRTNKWNILSSKLKYVHMFLLHVCRYLRLGRNFISWNSNYTAVFTSYCILLALAWCLFPCSVAARWILRLLVFFTFGPLMKLVDIFYFRRWFATKDELLVRIRNGDISTKESDIPDFDSLLESKTFSSMIHLGRMKAEELHKLRDMRMLMFGPFSELIPFFDNSRRPCVPLPLSTAIKTTHCDTSLAHSSKGYHVAGQLLSGNMIHSRDEVGSSVSE